MRPERSTLKKACSANRLVHNKRREMTLFGVHIEPRVSNVSHEHVASAKSKEVSWFVRRIENPLFAYCTYTSIHSYLSIFVNGGDCVL